MRKIVLSALAVLTLISLAPAASEARDGGHWDNDRGNHRNWDRNRHHNHDWGHNGWRNRGGFSSSIVFSSPAPVYYDPYPVAYEAPVYYAPQPRPVYYAPPPRPVYYAPRPVYYAPAPSYSFGLNLW